MHNKTTLITNIQRMCMSDGPGIRTTVFLKGCNLHCPWCANPENIRFVQESYQKEDTIGVYGAWYEADKLYTEIIKDQKFWKRQGGVTFSGGEPLMHVGYLQPIMQKLKAENIHIAVETALFVDAECVETVLPYVDLFLVDMKILQEDMCREVLGGNTSQYRHNLERLIGVQQESSKEVILRIPCNKEYTLQNENVDRILEWCRNHPQIPIEIFAIHSLGKSKYESLGRTCPAFEAISDEELAGLANRLRACGNDVTIQRL